MIDGPGWNDWRITREETRIGGKLMMGDVGAIELREGRLLLWRLTVKSKAVQKILEHELQQRAPDNGDQEPR